MGSGWLGLHGSVPPPPTLSSSPHRVFGAFRQGFATQQQQEPHTLLAHLACRAASQSQLGSFAATKFIPEDPLLGAVSSHRWMMLCSHPRISPTVPSTSSARTGRSHVVAHAPGGLGEAAFTRDGSVAGPPEDAPAWPPPAPHC